MNAWYIFIPMPSISTWNWSVYYVPIHQMKAIANPKFNVAFPWHNFFNNLKQTGSGGSELECSTGRSWVRTLAEPHQWFSVNLHANRVCNNIVYVKCPPWHKHIGYFCLFWWFHLSKFSVWYSTNFTINYVIQEFWVMIWGRKRETAII